MGKIFILALCVTGISVHWRDNDSRPMGFWIFSLDKTPAATIIPAQVTPEIALQYHAEVFVSTTPGQVKNLQSCFSNGSCSDFSNDVKVPMPPTATPTVKPPSLFP